MAFIGIFEIEQTDPRSYLRCASSSRRSQGGAALAHCHTVPTRGMRRREASCLPGAGRLQSRRQAISPSHRHTSAPRHGEEEEKVEAGRHSRQQEQPRRRELRRPDRRLSRVSESGSCLRQRRLATEIPRTRVQRSPATATARCGWWAEKLLP